MGEKIMQFAYAQLALGQGLLETCFRQLSVGSIFLKSVQLNSVLAFSAESGTFAGMAMADT